MHAHNVSIEDADLAIRLHGDTLEVSCAPVPTLPDLLHTHATVLA